MLIKNTQVVPVTIEGTSSIEETTVADFSFRVVPNPFEDEAQIEVDLVSDTDVTIKVIDLSGRIVFELSQQHLSAGKNTISFGDELSKSGSYFIQLFSEQFGLSIQKIIKL
jgi:hypothetical protein